MMSLPKKPTESGNTFFTALIFIFVLIGTLRLCCNKTLHESKLTGIFIQETQGYYLLENLMALARDYAYQINQNYFAPTMLLSASAYRKKDRTYQKSKGEENAWVIDFNGSLSKQQIVPDDFPLQIADDGWDIKGGPIFWQDKKKDVNDERWLSEVFMLGSIKLNSRLYSNWTMRMAQTMEIERNPLCDFQLYAEHDLSFTTWPALTGYDSIQRSFFGPVQINENARFMEYHGGGSEVPANDYFYNKFNIAGHGLRGKTGCNYISFPEKRGLTVNTGSSTIPYYTNGILNHNINKNAINSNAKATVSLAASEGPYYSNAWSDDTQQDYEHKAFSVFQGNLTTRSRIYRPLYEWFYFLETENDGLINFIVLLAILVMVEKCYPALGFGGTASQAGENLLFLYNVFSQKTNPGLLFQFNYNYDIVSSANVFSTHWPLAPYSWDAFNPKNDNSFLNKYLSLCLNKNLNAFNLSSVSKQFYNETITTNLINVSTDEELNALFSLSNPKLRILNNRLVLNSVSSVGLATSEFSNILKTKLSFSPTNYLDNSCPPHKIINCGTYWKMDDFVTRVKTTNAGYQFIYDHNRAKWIQIFDFDVSKLKAAIGNTISASDWNDMNQTVIFTCTDYPYHSYNSMNLKGRYSSCREDFFNNYSDGSYTSEGNYVDIGIRIINAESLPDGGLTIISNIPIYIKGNFNSESKCPKACIITDSITVLSNAWGDWKSQMNPYKSHLASWVQDPRYNPVPEDVSIYAHIMTGQTRPSNRITNDPNICPDLGFNDVIRTLEFWGNHKITVYGSIMIPYYSERQYEPPINFTSYEIVPNGNYGAPPLALPETKDEWERMRTVPNMLFYYRINRGRKTQTIGQSSYDILSGSTLYNRDWDDSGSFSMYHNALPNYLKYEGNP